MAYVLILDGAAASKYVKATGAGSAGDPFIIEHLETNSAAIAASLSVLDDWDETNRCAVNLIASQVGISAGAGIVAANTPRMTLASDDPAVSSLSTLAGVVSSSRAAVNPISGQTGIAGGAGIASATTTRVAIATDANTVDTELPTASQITADNQSAPTAPAVYAYNMVFDGSTWDRWTGAVTVSSGSVTVSATSLDIRPITSVSDSINAVQSGTWNISAVTTVSTLATVTNPVGIKGADGSGIVANANPLPVSDAGGSLTVDGTVAATQSGTWTVQPGNTANSTAWLVTGTGGTFPATQSGSWTVTANAGTNLNTSALALESGGNLATLAGVVSSSRAAVNPISGQSGIAGNAGSVGATTTRTVLAGCTTGTVTSVNDTAVSTTLLAANTSRIGATVYNDSTVDLYLKLGATASTSSFTCKIAPGGYYEVPANYNGIVDGIWSSDASGAARITELT